MAGFFERMLGRGRTNSAQTAKQRLQFVLVHDRINLPPEKLQAMKEEILAVISKYVQVASDDVDIALEQRDRNSNLLVAEVPFSKSLHDQKPAQVDIDENDDLSDAPEISSKNVPDTTLGEDDNEETMRMKTIKADSSSNLEGDTKK